MDAPEGAESVMEFDKDRYLVERIVDKQIIDGKPFYTVKWKNYDSDENTIEPAENLDDCDLLLQDFEKQHAQQKKRKKVSGRKKTASMSTGNETEASGPSSAASGRQVEVKAEYYPSPEERNSSSELDPTDPNLVCQKIIGATDSGGGLSFLVLWKGLNIATLVPAPIANKRFQLQVIDFYEERLAINAGGGRLDSDSE